MLELQEKQEEEVKMGHENFYGFPGDNPDEAETHYLDGDDLPSAPESELGVIERDSRFELICQRCNLFKETLATRTALISQFYERRVEDNGRVYLVPRDRKDHTVALLGTTEQEADRNWHKILVGLPKIISNHINSHLDVIEDRDDLRGES